MLLAYNLRSKDKHFEVGEKVLILTPDSTASRAFNKWTALLLLWKFCPPYIYVVDVAGIMRHFDTNKLCNCHV